MDNQFIVPKNSRQIGRQALNPVKEAPVVTKPVPPKRADDEYYMYSSDKVATDKPVHKFKQFFKPDLKRLIMAFCLVLVLLGASLLAYRQFHKTAVNIDAGKINGLYKAVTVSKTVPSNLSGLPVSPSLNNLPVTAVMIENSLDARPQSGLSQAMVVFEAVAEGGVTRFMALYQDTSPNNIGPIRSARPYYVSWAMGFDAAYAHVGGSPDALADIKSWGTRNLDEFAYGSYYHRISTREAPHNVYTSVSELNQLETKLGYNNSTFTPWKRKAESPLKTPTATQISMDLSGSIYNPSYTYNAQSNTYERSEGGSAQIDALNNQQIAPKVVIAIVVPETQGALDATGAYYSDYNVIGSNTAYVFQDGGETTGTWTKSSNTSNITFTTSNGKPLALDPGQVWITAITSPSALKYS